MVIGRDFLAKTTGMLNFLPTARAGIKPVASTVKTLFGIVSRNLSARSSPHMSMRSTSTWRKVGCEQIFTSTVGFRRGKNKAGWSLLSIGTYHVINERRDLENPSVKHLPFSKNSLLQQSTPDPLVASGLRSQLLVDFGGIVVVNELEVEVLPVLLEHVVKRARHRNACIPRGREVNGDLAYTFRQKLFLAIKKAGNGPENNLSILIRSRP
mmetsp:Transcript_18139/g.72620  ORF Transcript_18139/g.72620 Transcript_18139/m.72620 type:complete len:211 (+) Transcript_18139:1812-2444(+)